jgi:hypothetical protein
LGCVWIPFAQFLVPQAWEGSQVVSQKKLPRQLRNQTTLPLYRWLCGFTEHLFTKKAVTWKKNSEALNLEYSKWAERSGWQRRRWYEHHYPFT